MPIQVVNNLPVGMITIAINQFGNTGTAM